MKIIQILYYPGQGGTEQYIYLLSKYAKADGCETQFIFGMDGPFVKRVKDAGFKVSFIKMRSPFDLVAIWHLTKLFNMEKPDVVHTHFLRENFLSIIASKFSKAKAVVSTVHRIEKKSKIKALFNRIYSYGLDKFIAVSPLAKELLVSEGIKVEKIAIVPNGVDIEIYKPEEIKKEIAYNKEYKVVTFVGRMTKEKGHALLLKAFSLIEDKKTKLVLVGDGILKGEIEKNIKELGLEKKISLVGNRENAYEIIGVSDIYVQPSLTEVMPISVVEAMMQGVPVIASDIPAHQLLFKKEEHDLLFVSGNYNDLFNKLNLCLSNLDKYRTRALKAKEYANKHYSAKQMWLNTLREYKK